MTLKQLPKPGSYAAYLQTYFSGVQTGPALTKKAFKAQKKAANQAAKQAQKAANAAQLAAATAAGTAAGSDLAAGLLPGEAQVSTGGSTPFAGGGDAPSKLAAVAAVVVPFGLLGLVAWYVLKRKRK